MHTNTAGTLSLFTVSGQRKYLTSEERLNFLAAAERQPRAEVRTLCTVLAYTGCRISEALALTAASFDVSEGFVAVRCLKKRSAAPVIREVPLPSDLLELVRAVHGLDPTYLGRLWHWSRSGAWLIVKSVMREAGIADGPHATPKGLRHGFGLHAVRCGIPINLVQRWLGHASMTTTAIYLQAIGPEERAIAARMWECDVIAATSAPASADIDVPVLDGSAACPQKTSSIRPSTTRPTSSL